MTFEEIKAAVMNLSADDQKRLITEIVPTIWPKACLDEACVAEVKKLVDEDTVRQYKEQHMGSI